MSNESLTYYLKEFRLPTMAVSVEAVIELAEKEQWSPRRVLAQLLEAEYQDRRQRRIERLLKESHLPATETLDSAELKLWTPEVRRALSVLREGHFVHRCQNVCCFGLTGRGKSRFIFGLGRELILDYQMRVLSVSASVLIERLTAAREQLRLENELRKLRRYSVVIVD